MPFAEIAAGFRLYYRLDGDASRPVVVLSNSLGADLSMWDPQRNALLPFFRVLRYDTRGHGQSGLPPGPCTLAMLAGDVLTLLDHLEVERAAVCGVSLGGLTAMWLGVHASTRVRCLALGQTAARIGTADIWNERIRLVRESGMAAIAEVVPTRWFTPGCQAQRPDLLASAKAMLLGCSAPGYIAACEAIRDADLRADIGAIPVPVLAISGAGDPVTPPAEGLALQAAIAGAFFCEVPGSHLANLEDPNAYNAVLVRFFEQHATEETAPMNDEERTRAGMAARRAVLGDAHVDRAAAKRDDPFQAGFQDLITRYAWGEIWTRPGLPRHTRSLLTIAMMVALNRAEELRLHLRAAANNGVTREEIQEVLLQCAVYCGVPAANSAFHLAAEVFASMDAEAASDSQQGRDR